MIAILGGGPCGLSVGYHLLAETPVDFRILEGSDSVGGLCKSIRLPDGGTVDCGGHAFFTDHASLRDLMQRNNGDNLVWTKRLPSPRNVTTSPLTRSELCSRRKSHFQLVSKSTFQALPNKQHLPLVLCNW